MSVVFLAPELPRFLPGRAPRLEIRADESGGYVVRITRLGALVREIALELPAGSSMVELGELAPGGYVASAGGAYASVDVQAREGEDPRYAFLSDFSPGGEGGDGWEDSLRSLRATHVQFYDWMYRHHEFLPPGDAFRDAMGRELSLAAVRSRIARCHGLGLRAVAYGAVYGAEAEYFDSRPEERLYRGDGSPALFIGKIGYMNIEPGNPWRERILGQYEAASSELGFDGIHMDQYGEPHRALAADGRPVDLAECFGSLVDEAKARLEAVRRCSFVVFNCVNDWPIEKVASSAEDAVYVEVWDPHSRYRHLRDIARRARLLAPGKPVILAAYLRAYASGAPDEEKEEAALLALAAIHASGATQLAYGEDRGVLTEGYYVNHARYRPGFAPILSAWMDFCVAYRELLRGRDMEDQGFRLVGGPNEAVSIEGIPVSLDYEPGMAGVALSEGPGIRVLSLLNLLGQGDDSWSEPKRIQDPCPAVLVRWLVPGGIEAVYTASPDEGLEARALGHRMVPHPQGMAAEFELPPTARWRLAWIIARDG